MSGLRRLLADPYARVMILVDLSTWGTAFAAALVFGSPGIVAFIIANLAVCAVNLCSPSST